MMGCTTFSVAMSREHARVTRRDRFPLAIERPACAAVQSLKTGVERGADSAAGWLGLAELQYQLRQYQVPCRRTTLLQPYSIIL